MDIAQLISNVGFPIFSFIVTGLACKYVYDKESKRNDMLVEDNMEKLEQLTLAVNNNTAVLQQMVAEVHTKLYDDHIYNGETSTTTLTPNYKGA